MSITKADLKALIGRRVRVTECSPASVVGGVGVVTDVYSDTEDDPMVYVKLDPQFEQGPHSDGRWVISGWVEVTPIDEITRDNVVGMTLIAGYVPGYADMTGKEFVVTEVHPSSSAGWTNSMCVKGEFGGHSLWVHTWTIPPQVEDETVRFIREKDEEIARLKELLKAEQDRLRESQRYYSHDLRIINEVANEEADNQDWCGTYEETLDRMNAKLIGGFTLIGRTTNWTVDAYEEVIVRVRRSWCGEARNEDDAKEAAGAYFDNESLSDDDVIEALREYAEPEHHRMQASYDWTVEKD